MKTVEKLRIAPIGTIVNFADRTLIIKRFRAIVKGKMVICRGAFSVARVVRIVASI